MRKNSKIAERVSSPGHLLRENVLKPAIDAGFRFMDIYHSQGIAMKFVHFKPPKLVKGKHHWYVEYYYKNSENKWVRFKVYEEINIHRSEEYNQLLLEAVQKNLESGFNPFELKKKPAIAPTEWSLNKALDEFIRHCQDKGLRPKSVTTYNESVRMLKEYFLPNNQIYQPVTAFTRQHFQKFGSDMSDKKKWKNSTYNKRMENIRTIFHWFEKEGKVEKNPMIGIESKKTLATRHKYFSTETLQKLKDLTAEKDPYIRSFLEFLYYTCIRPKSEARLLQIKHILFDRQMIVVPGEISKNKKTEYVPMDPELSKNLIHLQAFPSEYFIWGKKGPEAQPAPANYFGNRFKPFKDELGLGEDYTMYGMKHTRAIDLANAGVDPYAIMKLCRHSGLDVTMAYLRDLGCDIDFSKYLNTKKF